MDWLEHKPLIENFDPHRANIIATLFIGVVVIIAAAVIAVLILQVSGAVQAV